MNIIPCFISLTSFKKVEILIQWKKKQIQEIHGKMFEFNFPEKKCVQNVYIWSSNFELSISDEFLSFSILCG